VLGDHVVNAKFVVDLAEFGMAVPRAWLQWLLEVFHSLNEQMSSGTGVSSK
jgi:hypothetical protein